MKINTYNLFGDETFNETWIIVVDKNNYDIQVTLDELIDSEDIPFDPDIHVKVDYYGKSWLIPKNAYFPI